MEIKVKAEEIIRKIVSRLAEAYRPEKIILFGSYAYGKPGPDSDIDLFIIKDTSDRPIDRRVAVSKILSDPARRVPLETIVLTPEETRARLKIGDQFVREIMDKGKVLYEQ